MAVFGIFFEGSFEFVLLYVFKVPITLVCSVIKNFDKEPKHGTKGVQISCTLPYKTTTDNMSNMENQR